MTQSVRKAPLPLLGCQRCCSRADGQLNYHVITAEPDLLTVLIAGGGFDHHAVDHNLRGQLADIMITGPANEGHRRSPARRARASDSGWSPHRLDKGRCTANEKWTPM
jgi:hypothetical protein